MNIWTDFPMINTTISSSEKKKYKTNRKLDMDNEGLDRRRWKGQ
jgi:hypothetical protein